MGFTLARLQYLDFDGVYCNPNNNGMNGAAPGECYYYTKGHYEIGIRLHLYTILPAAFLAVFQFVPAIRHKIILFHRINGYVIIILSLFGIVGRLKLYNVVRLCTSDILIDIVICRRTHDCQNCFWWRPRYTSRSWLPFHSNGRITCNFLLQHKTSSDRSTSSVDVESVVLRMSSSCSTTFTSP